MWNRSHLQPTLAAITAAVTCHWNMRARVWRGRGSFSHEECPKSSTSTRRASEWYHSAQRHHVKCSKQYTLSRSTHWFWRLQTLHRMWQAWLFFPPQTFKDVLKTLTKQCVQDLFCFVSFRFFLWDAKNGGAIVLWYLQWPHVHSENRCTHKHMHAHTQIQILTQLGEPWTDLKI